jgi:hypothetical protein
MHDLLLPQFDFQVIWQMAVASLNSISSSTGTTVVRLTAVSAGLNRVQAVITGSLDSTVRLHDPQDRPG